ncbi:MAG: thiolase family protein [Dethiobacter sp.]|jgi:acetyl-CoA C-acetyltransferase|nr:thiolase family protein [Dethiobacter sp.]MBS3900709.1 thiolase family protein [Dethiobacter sp.]MBS3989156.1 thiolase family protein [Dethiobacter sp.]
MKEAVIISGARTPIARENGALRDVPPEKYAALVIREAVNRAGIDPATVDQVVMGHCLGAAGCIARIAWLEAGFPFSVPGLTIDRQCGSGSEAVNLAAALILSGQAEIVVAGGAESMTRMPYLLEKPASPYQRSAPVFIQPRPLSPKQIGDPPMGITAENVAERYKVSREDQDAFGLASQQKAERAIREGRFKEQIVPVLIPQKKGDPVVFDTDEHPRFGITLEALTKLPSVFKKDGTVTAGTSSGINDGAGALVIMERGKAEALGLKPMGLIRAAAAAGVDPNIMGIGPVPATKLALKRAGITADDLDVIELNEAFASQALACIRELGLNMDKVNPNGGAIALGHPIAGSLAILTVKLIYELQRQKARYGLVSACCGGGQGVATIIERM